MQEQPSKWRDLKPSERPHRTNWSKSTKERASPHHTERRPEKDATIVLKNIPQDYESSDLIEKLQNEYDIEPDTIMYHYDTDGKFSGIAMVKYSSVEEAAEMMEQLAGLKIKENVIRLEYKWKRFDETEEYQQYFEQLKQFSENSLVSEMTFDSSLTSFQRKQIHIICEKLNLAHESKTVGKDRMLLVSKQFRGEKRGSRFPRKSEQRPIVTERKKEKTIRPIRQPRGPNDTLGFSQEFQEYRKLELRTRGQLLRVSVTDLDGEPVDLLDSE